MTQAQKLGVGIAVLAIIGALAVGVYGRSRGRAPADVEIYSEPAQLPVEPPIQVHVTGAVRSPNVYVLPAGSRAWQAVEAAGGLLGEADRDAVNLAAVLSDGDRLVIPSVATAPPTPDTGYAGPHGGLIDINRAPAEQLETLPGIGEEIARRIVSHRMEHGPFHTVESLTEVSGIGEAKLREIRGRVTVQPYPNP